MRGTFSSVITSPPYWDLQDYRAPNQIGFGQSSADFLRDMRNVFEACAELTSDDATMWLVVGFLRRQGRIVMLPAILSEEAAAVGWTPREWVTWEKHKSLPFAKHGELRDVTEYAVLLSKTPNHAFHVEDLLDPVPTSPWWERYPERYSPRGRRPTNSWRIPIPTQGAWKDGPDHACPFPLELTFRLLTLVTRPGDAVLDPFAGVGSVPALAHAMGRRGFGVELSPASVSQFDTTLQTATDWWAHKQSDLVERSSRRQHFEATILQLRMLKYARILGLGLQSRGLGVCWVRALPSGEPSDRKYAETAVTFDVATTVDACTALVAARQIGDSKPLSKFGLDASFTAAIPDASRTEGLWYRDGKFWRAPTASFPGASLTPHVVAPFEPDLQQIRSWVCTP